MCLVSCPGFNQFQAVFFSWLFSLGGFHMGVEPKIGGKPPKWMVKLMENPIEMYDLGVPLFLETPISYHYMKNGWKSPFPSI